MLREVDIAFLMETHLLDAPPLLPEKWRLFNIPAVEGRSRPREGTMFAVSPRFQHCEMSVKTHKRFDRLDGAGCISTLRIKIKDETIIFICGYRHGKLWKNADFFECIAQLVRTELQQNRLARILVGGDFNLQAPPLPGDDAPVRNARGEVVLPCRSTPQKAATRAGHDLKRLAQAFDLTTISGRQRDQRYWTFVNRGITPRGAPKSQLDFMLVTSALLGKVKAVKESAALSLMVHPEARAYHKVLVAQFALSPVQVHDEHPGPKHGQMRWSVEHVSDLQRQQMREAVTTALARGEGAARWAAATEKTSPEESAAMLTNVLETSAKSADLYTRVQKRRKAAGPRRIALDMSRAQLSIHAAHAVKQHHAARQLGDVSMLSKPEARDRLYKKIRETERTGGPRSIQPRLMRDSSTGDMLTTEGESAAAVRECWKGINNDPPDQPPRNAAWNAKWKKLMASELAARVPKRGEATPASAPFEAADLERIIRSRKNGKAAGADGIPYDLLKICLSPSHGATPEQKQQDQRFIDALLQLFNQCWRTELVPDTWCEALITLIYKGSGDKHLPQKYRPISLVPVLAKIYQALILHRMEVLWEIGAIEQLNPAQAAYRQRHSCGGNRHLLRKVVHECRAKAQKLLLATVDISKAYNTVDRKILLCKLHAMGVQGKLWRVISNLHDNTTETVVWRTQRLAPYTTKRGIPQGTVLSPILFSIMVNDLASHMLTTELIDTTTSFTDPGAVPTEERTRAFVRRLVMQYSDDTILLAYSETDMQSLLESIAQWAADTRLKLNMLPKKSDVIVAAGAPSPATTFTTHFGTTELTDRLEYLGGVTASASSTVQRHDAGRLSYQLTANLQSFRAGLIKTDRYGMHRSELAPADRAHLYATYAQSKLSAPAFIMAPRGLTQLEKIELRALKQCAGIQLWHYPRNGEPVPFGRIPTKTDITRELGVRSIRNCFLREAVKTIAQYSTPGQQLFQTCATPNAFTLRVLDLLRELPSMQYVSIDAAVHPSPTLRRNVPGYKNIVRSVLTALDAAHLGYRVNAMQTRSQHVLCQELHQSEWAGTNPEERIKPCLYLEHWISPDKWGEAQAILDLRMGTIWEHATACPLCGVPVESTEHLVRTHQHQGCTALRHEQREWEDAMGAMLSAMPDEAERVHVKLGAPPCWLRRKHLKTPGDRAQLRTALRATAQLARRIAARIRARRT